MPSTAAGSRSEPSRHSYDVIIVGGAIIGSATAYFLAANPDFKGTILVVERDWSYAHSATSLSLSSIRHQFSTSLNVRMSQFATEFIRNAGEILSHEGGPLDLRFRENGYLFLAPSGRGAEVLKRNHLNQRACGADVELLDPAALAAKYPWINTDGVALASAGRSGEGWFDNVALLNALRRRARSLGAEYVENEVVAITRGRHKITGARLAGGQQLECGVLINAAGTRGAAVAALARLELPVEARRRCVFVLSCPTPLSGTVPLTIDTGGVYFRPEGAYYLAGGGALEDPAVDVEDFAVIHAEFEDRIWPALAARVSAFESLRLVNAWAGHYDHSLLDHNAIIGPHDELENFLFANGFSGHGLQQAPAVGRALSEWITYGAYRSLDLGPLGYSRITANRPFIEESVI